MDSSQRDRGRQCDGGKLGGKGAPRNQSDRGDESDHRNWGGRPERWGGATQ